MSELGTSGTSAVSNAKRKKRLRRAVLEAIIKRRYVKWKLSSASYSRKTAKGRHHSYHAKAPHPRKRTAAGKSNMARKTRLIRTDTLVRRAAGHLYLLAIEAEGDDDGTRAR